MATLRYPSEFVASGEPKATDYIKIQFVRRDYTASDVRYNSENNTIILNMPQKITESVTQNFANSGLGELGMLEAFGNRNNVAGNFFARSIQRVVENLALNNSVKMMNRLGASQLSENGILSGVSGVVFNPNLEVLYEGPDFRRFNFQFALFTKSQEDAKQIKAIVDTFRKASLPSLSGADVKGTKLAEAFQSIAGLQTGASLGAGASQAVTDAIKKGKATLAQGGLSFAQGALGGLLNAGATSAAGTGIVTGAFFSGANRFIKQPPFIYLQYMRGLDRHPFIPSLLPAALNQVSFDYTPTGNYTVLSDFAANGDMATTIGVTITLQLTEVTNLFGDQLDKDFQPKKPNGVPK